MNAQVVPIDPQLISAITFPDNKHTQISIPADAITFQRSKEGAEIIFIVLIIVSDSRCKSTSCKLHC